MNQEKNFGPGILDARHVRHLVESAVNAPGMPREAVPEFVVIQKGSILRDAGILLFGHSAADPRFELLRGARNLIWVCRRWDQSGEEGFECDWAARFIVLSALQLGFEALVVRAPQGLRGSSEICSELGIPGEWRPLLAVVIGMKMEEEGRRPRRPARILNWVK
jgi:hypothetical protein